MGETTRPGNTPSVPRLMVRVTVTSSTRRVDLALPGSVPVAHLIPDLARSVGLLGASVAHGGYRLVTTTGRNLSNEVGVGFQGVQDGDVLTVHAGVEEQPPLVYDDLAEALTNVVEGDLTTWEPSAGKHASLLASGLFAVLGAAALAGQRGSGIAVVSAASIAGVLAVAAIVLSRTQANPKTGIVAAWMAAAYAAAAGFLSAPVVDVGGPILLFCGVFVSVTGLGSVVGMGNGRILAAPPALAGVLVAVTGGVGLVLDLAVSTGVAWLLTLIVLFGSVLPRMALGATSLRSESMQTFANSTFEGHPIDRRAVAADAALAHQILLALTSAIGLVLLVCAPVLVDAGVFGTALALVACLSLAIRARHYRVRAEVAAALGSSLLGAAVVAGWTVATRADWLGPASAALTGLGAMFLAGALLPRDTSVRRQQAGDVAETISLLALAPLMVLTIGLPGIGL